MRCSFTISIVLLRLLMPLSSYAANTHIANPGSTTLEEMRGWFGAGFASYIQAGCAPTVPGRSLTLAAFACNGYVRGASTNLVYVTQSGAAVGPLNGGDGMYWLALHRDTTSTMTGWTRQGGTSYLWKLSVTQPAAPTGGLLFAQVTVVGGVITAVQRPKGFCSNPHCMVVNVTDPVFDADASGVTDSTTALQGALAVPNAVVRIPQGTYKYSSNLVPSCAQVIGDGELASILQPTAAVTKGMSIGGTSYPTRLQNLQIDGTNTTNATGLFVGDATSVAVLVESVFVKSFTGSSGVGIRIGDVLKSQFTKVTSALNNTNLLTQKVSGGFPTTVQFDSCVFTDAVVNAYKGVDGHNIIFRNSDFESSGQEGVLLLPTFGGTLFNIVFDQCWFEDNYRGNTTQYQFVAGDGTGLGNATITPVIRDSYFATTASTAKPIRMNGSAVAGFIISAPRIASAVTGSISIENSAYGEIPEWQATSGMTFSTVVNDPNNLVSGRVWTEWRNWAPTVTDSAGTGFTAIPTISYAKYKRVERTVHVDLKITATLAGAGNPTSIRATIPPGLTAGTESVISTPIQIGATWQAGIMNVATDGNIYFQKADITGFGAGATFIVRGSINYQLP